MIIAIIGASGAGKSTVISSLKQWKFLKKSKVVVKDEDNFLTINLLKSIFGNKLFNEYKQQKFFNKAPQSLTSKLFSWIVSWFYPAIIYLEFLVTHIFYSTFWKNRVLISDRYIYDYLITFEEMLKIRRPIFNFLVTKFPRPSLCFYLQISKKVSLTRNKDNVPGKITANSHLHGLVLKRYDSLAKQLAIIKVRGDQNKIDMINEVKDMIYFKEKLMQTKSLSISGIDGSGKTTTCNNIHELCQRLNISSSIVHFYHLPILYKLFKGVGPKRIPTSNTKVHDQSLKSFLWALLTFLDSHIQYAFARITRLGTLIIYDRYFYDYLVSFKYRKVVASGLFGHFIPRLDKSFVFVINPNEVIKRETDRFKNDYFQDVHDLYLDLVKKQKLITIQIAKKSPNAVLRAVIQEL